MSKKNHSSFVEGLIIGGAMGAIAGLLWAPRTGKETRRLIKKTAEAMPDMATDVGTSLQKNMSSVSSVARENWHDTLNRLQEALQVGLETSQLTAQRLRDPGTSFPEDS